MVFNFVCIDWDYCIPMHINNDFAHKENKLFIHDIWDARSTALIWEKGEIQLVNMEEIKTNISLPEIKNPGYLGVAESNANGYSFINQYLAKLVEDCGEGDFRVNIHHFDLHHDIWKGYDQIGASNWLRKIAIHLSEEYNVRIFWYPPPWFIEQGYSLPVFGFKENSYELIENHDNIFIDAKFKQPEKIENVGGLFVCRSGAWTPPHLDWDFRDLALKYVKIMLGKLGEEKGFDNMFLYDEKNRGVNPIAPREYKYIKHMSPNQLKNSTKGEKRNV